ncbi:hypothetical protein Glove_372g94 [Diversispora epigaea]|uniref:Uncharacterized protein n=1 Tax=Diversispora epigaea TaxID=1348612 RepID=A0A397HB30_9GLOM|nr:hypothetical protein Glove_372g94 [Diversispora epigaea]
MSEDMDEESPLRRHLDIWSNKYFIHKKLPPQQIFPIVMDYVTAYTQNPDPKYRKAGMMAFADELFLLFYDEICDPEVIMRRGSCIALGCLAAICSCFKEIFDRLMAEKNYTFDEMSYGVAVNLEGILNKQQLKIFIITTLVVVLQLMIWV